MNARFSSGRILVGNFLDQCVNMLITIEVSIVMTDRPPVGNEVSIVFLPFLETLFVIEWSNFMESVSFRNKLIVTLFSCDHAIW